MKGLLLSAALLAGACDTVPRDADGTLDRVQGQRHFKVGLIAAGGQDLGAAPRNAFLARVARATGAAPAVEQGAFEPLLLELEAGRLDLVLGPVSPDSPWSDRVAILPAIAETAGPQHLLLAPIARNGENRWIMLLESEAHAAAAGPAR